MKKIYILLAGMLMAAGMSAAELTVADGTETNASLPICGYYADYAFKGQMLYPSVDIAVMAKGEISSLTFYSSTATQTFGSGTISVKMAEVSESALSASPLAPEFTEVYNGAYSIEGGKLVIAFTTKFTYSGSKNLLLDISCVNKGSAPSDDNWFYGQSASAAGYSNYVKKGTYTYSPDVENFLPKTTFAYTAEAATCAQPTNVSASTVDAKAASLQWDKADAADQVQYALVEEGASVVWSEPTTDGSKELSGLKPLTNYSFYVRTYCSTSDQSAPIKTTFTTGKSCFEPKDLVIEDVTGNTAKLKWNTGGSETNFQFVVVKEGETPDWSKAKESGKYLEQLQDLNPSTNYVVYVRAMCSDDEFSAAESVSFKTDCGKISSLPWEENFATADAIDCWTISGKGRTMILSGNLWFEMLTEDNHDKLVVLPEFEMELDTLAISFKYQIQYSDVTLEFGYIDENNDFVAIKYCGFSNKFVDVQNFKLTSVPQTVRLLAFHGYVGEEARSISLDDIKVHVPEIETGIESIQHSDVSIQKVIRDGQIVIIREGKEYNLLGGQK